MESPGKVMPNESVTATAADRAWHKLLVEGHKPILLAHRFFRYLPSPPRCKLCHNPFGGIGGKLVGLFGFSPSRKNPNLCARCCDALPPGGAEVDIAVLFADIRVRPSWARGSGRGRLPRRSTGST